MIGVQRLKLAFESFISLPLENDVPYERSFFPITFLLIVLGLAIVGFSLSDVMRDTWHPLLIGTMCLLSLGGLGALTAFACGFIALPAFHKKHGPSLLESSVLFAQEVEDVAAASCEENEERSFIEMADTPFFHNCAMAIATLTSEGRIVQTNGAFERVFRVHVGLHESSSLDLCDLVAPQERGLLADKIKGLKGITSEPMVVDVNLECAQNRSARFYMTALPESVQSIRGEVAIAYGIDTTEQRALETNFFQIQKLQAVGQLAGGLAHDFNNVLQAIIGYSDLLLSHHRPTDPSFQDIMHIKQNANRAAGLVRQLLAFSRQQTLRPQVIQLVEVFADLAPLFRRLLGERITLDIHHGRNLWPIKADLTNFEQVMINLVVNARDAMPSGGKLTIRTLNVSFEDVKNYHYALLAEGEYALIEVTDEGVGIPPELLNKVFEPFFTTKEVGKGTGLGLATVYGIVKQTGGVVFCDSVVNEGTRFRIFLPRYAESDAPAPVKTLTAVHALADLTGRGCILLVEDEEAVRAFAARALTTRGYTVLQAASGREALDIIEQQGEAIDLVISDVMMPEMDGPTLFRELQQKHKELRMVFISGYAEEAFRKHFSDQDTFTLLLKPFTLKQLVETVKQVLG